MYFCDDFVVFWSLKSALRAFLGVPRRGCPRVPASGGVVGPPLRTSRRKKEGKERREERVEKVVMHANSNSIIQIHNACNLTQQKSVIIGVLLCRYNSRKYS